MDDSTHEVDNDSPSLKDEPPADRTGRVDAVQIKTHSVSRRAFFRSATLPFAVGALSRLVSSATAAGSHFLEPRASSLLAAGLHIHDHPVGSESAVDAADGSGASAGAPTDPGTNIGIAETSLTPVARGAAASGGGRPGSRPMWDAFELLEKCHQLGASGIQTELNGNLTKLRIQAAELGMWIEGMVSVPRNADTGAFEQNLIDAKTAGATVVRTALLGGRRYESFSKLEDWKRWVEQAHQALKLVVPIVDRHKVTLAIENHKDWTLEEMQRLLKTYESEYVGCCFDFGNNIALLDDPMEMAQALAPYVRSTHVKDMAVHPYQDGFLLSEVPLGTGLLDLPRMVHVLRRANPALHLSLEMITRDPLKVPCLTPQYWTVFPERNGKYLAQTLRLVQQHGAAAPLPTVSQLSPEQRLRVEEENVKSCLRYAGDNLKP